MKGKIYLWLFILTVSVIIIVSAIVSGCINYDNIHIEGYISILATLIGILVTFAVGYQIINTIEIKNEQKRIISQQEEADKKLGEVKEYADKTEKVSELLKKQTLFNNSKDEPSKLLLQLDCIKLYIELKWSEDNYGMDMFKLYCQHRGCLEHGSFMVMDAYSRGILDLFSLVNSFKEQYIEKIKAIKNAATKYSLTTQTIQVHLLEKCLDIQVESIINIENSGKITHHKDAVYDQMQELVNEYDKLAQS